LSAGNGFNVPSAEYMLQNSNMGTDFYVAVPQNDIKNGQQEKILAFYICSYADTRVRFEHLGAGVVKYRDVKAYQPMSISSKTGDASFTWEIINSEVVEANGIHITSDDPISVYVLNSRATSSDGFLAIPTEAWGYKYVHCAFYDHRESSNYRRGGGFIVLASRDGTSITIQLKGTGGSLGQTVGKKKIGETISANLMAGQTFMVRGDASTDQGFDISGTIISSNNPIGVISFHQRTMIPNECPNGRDHLCEMLPPVQSWGKEFVTCAFDRGNLGDLIRVVSSEDDTRVQGTSFQMGSGNVLEYFDRTLKAGEFFEHYNTICNSNNKQTGVRGLTVWKTSKPAMMMQYAYSFPWDGVNKWDPLMVVIPPVEQFKKSIVFQPAVESDFIDNQLTFFAVGNPNDPDKKLLNSVLLDGQEISKSSQMFLYNQIPSTNIYWGRIKITQEVHNITSDTKIAGYINGFSGYNSYAWPFIFGTDKLDQLDTLPPEILVDNINCGNYTMTVLEQRNIFAGDIPHIDQGIRRILLLKELSYNYSLELFKPNLFIPEKGVYEQKIFLNIIDPHTDAKAYIATIDRAGNYSIDSISYDAPNLSSNFNIVDFGNVRQNTKSILKMIVTNTEIDSLLINKINLQKTDIFNIIDIVPNTFPLKLKSNESATITIEFKPVAEFTYDDSLIIESTCYRKGFAVNGTGVLPKISVEDWFAGSIEVGGKVCYEDIFSQGFKIFNPGTDTLIIDSFDGINPPFLLSDPLIPPLPISVSPNQIIYLESVCFNPQDTGTFRNDVIIKSNAGNEDTISIWRGFAYSKVFVEESGKNNELNFKVIPNPSTADKITIQFEIQKYSNIKIELFDNDSKFFDSLLNSNVNEGQHILEYSTNSLASGIYFIALTIDDKKIIKKLIIYK